MRIFVCALAVTGLLACDESAILPDGGSHLDAGEAVDDGGRPNDAAAHDAASPDSGMTQDAGRTSSDAGSTIVVDPGAIPSGAALYTTDGTEYGIRELGDALDNATDASTDNVIIYVHGRACGGGGEPSKSLSEAMPEMERDYDAKAIMMVWPGADSGCPIGFPESRARESGGALAAVIYDLYRYRIAHPSLAMRFTLITHSMGSIVLEEALEVAGVTALPATTFDVVMVNSSGSEADGHADWLSSVGFSPFVYVSVNSGDRVLLGAGVGRGTRLGRDIDDVDLAAGVDYVDFSSTSANHAYYLVDGQDGAPCARSTRPS